MPFGAQFVEHGAVRFRLWAPRRPRVALCLDAPGGEETLPMNPGAGGWHEVVTARVGSGARYRFDIGAEARVPDPASRYQPEDVHGPSEVIDPCAYRWRDAGWRGRAWEEAVIYELHVGAFTPEGTFRAVIARLDEVADLGVTAVELMPVADFPGARNWGYDGVLPFAPDSRYGRPEDLKALVDAAHARGMMVLLDVVYNHFGPEGNYLHLYAPDFFTQRHRTPWGAAINFDGSNARPVRDFFMHNALYWIEEYHMDGLRLDAVHAIADDSDPDILLEIAATVRQSVARERQVHLVLENDRNEARYLRRDPDGRARHYSAQWNDDAHHAFHVLLTGETDGYYGDYAPDPARHLGRCLTEGFAYQGEVSAYRNRARRGESSAGLDLGAFVSFLQTHDQVGNRAFGERLATLAREQALRAATTALLLAPSPPLLFMGEEFGAVTPFLFFCDFGPELAAAVTAGRRLEFARFGRFSDAAARASIPDPNDPATFARSKLDWTCRSRRPHAQWRALYRAVLAVRHEHIAPRLRGMRGHAGRFTVVAKGALTAEWLLGDGSRLHLVLNLSAREHALSACPPGDMLHCEPAAAGVEVQAARLPAAAAACYLDRGPGVI
ncbi:MAG: malto-oligosyltrehalose trehalohydrolase [Betaproteobacteria bacterium]|nr:malto-oligosyltrehalose trehalohydrolase [Betaproteobacteria bacterium]